jgi:hypothetical protein
MYVLTLLFALATSAGVSNHSMVAKQQVDMIELNHFVDENGRHVFDQVVFYQWVEHRHRFRVIAWRMVKRPSQLPIRTWEPHGWRCVWQDENVMRNVWAPTFRETWTQRDPERINREYFAEATRPDLVKPPAIRAGAIETTAP